MTSSKSKLEGDFIARFRDLKYTFRDDIRDRAWLEANFREKFRALNHVKLTDVEFDRLLTEIVTPYVFTDAHIQRNRYSFPRDDITPREATASNHALIRHSEPAFRCLDRRASRASCAVGLCKAAYRSRQAAHARIP